MSGSCYQRFNVNLTDSTGDREKMACQRFTVNVTSLCSFHQGNGHIYFVVLPFRGRELVRDFRGEDGIGPLGFFCKLSANFPLSLAVRGVGYS